MCRVLSLMLCEVGASTCCEHKMTERLNSQIRTCWIAQLDWVAFCTQDKDFLKEAAQRFRSGGDVLFGIVFAHQLKVSIAECVTDLEIIAKNSEPFEWYNRVEHLPL